MPHETSTNYPGPFGQFRRTASRVSVTGGAMLCAIGVAGAVAFALAVAVAPLEARAEALAQDQGSVNETDTPPPSAPEAASPGDGDDDMIDGVVDGVVDPTLAPTVDRALVGGGNITSGPLSMLVADSEFVFGPSLYAFEVDTFVAAQGGYLARYHEIVDGEVRTGGEIVQRVAEEFSVGPRMLLALIEMHSGWVRDAEPIERNFPVAEPLPGLYPSLSAAADKLNNHYYSWRLAGQQTIALAGGTTVRIEAPNAGTYGMVAYLSQGSDAMTFVSMVDTSRFYNAWTSMFGDAQAYAAAPTLPESIPPLQLELPFAGGEIWFYVRGPRSPWGATGPRAAIDFAPPPVEQLGCAPSPSKVLAAASGTVVRSRASGVLVDTNGDDFIGSGWVHVYSHLTQSGRVEEGQRIRPGDPLGHASCEAGATQLARVAFSRRYNGEWIPADAPGAPLVMGGWAVLAGDDPGTGWLIHDTAEPREAVPTKDPLVNGVTASPWGAP